MRKYIESIEYKKMFPWVILIGLMFLSKLAGEHFISEPMHREKIPLFYLAILFLGGLIIIGTKELINAGMNVGRDIMGTMADTLILAYVGSSLNIMLMFSTYDISLIEIISLDNIAAEIVRSLAGSVGLIFTVPVTAAVAGLLRDKNIFQRGEKKTA